jgi:hypothetical protein
MAPIILTVIIIVAAAGPIKAILEVIFWVLSDGNLSTIDSKNCGIYKSLALLFGVIFPKFGELS